jgi:hypothetical protein
MKITIESTSEVAHANGLPVRIWTGATERGTPVLALVTRVATLEGADASEFERELSEPPTRLVDPSGEAIASPRSCTVCLARDIRRPATHVARDAAGLEWFECGDHAPTDNLTETRRLALEPIADWFDRHERPLPAGVYRGPASDREPWASIIATGELPFTAARAADVLRGAVDAKVAELTSECRSLRARLKDRRETTWLVKDFLALYSAAVQTLGIETLAQAKHSRGWLVLQLARLRPAFEVCDSERRGAPDRLTAAEREALVALHRWLHSPGGDCDLIESAQAYHQQIAESDGPSECKRLEADELRENAIERGLVAHVDGGLAWPDDAELERVVREAFGELAAHMPLAAEAELQGIVDGALAHNREHRAPAASEHHCTPTPPLVASVVRALLEHPGVGGDDTDPESAAVFLGYALRGAQLGWHTRHAHRAEISLVGRVGAPLDEPHRSAWLAGYLAGIDDPAEGETPPAPATSRVCRVCKCTDDDCSQCVAKTGAPCFWYEPDLCSACAPKAFELTDALREQARELGYRAPETLTAADRALIAACEADETARTKSPETWVGGER